MKTLRITACLLLVALLFGCGSDPISKVKDGTLEFDKSITVGKAIDNYKFYTKVKWRSFQTPQGRTIVEARCSIDKNAMINSIYYDTSKNAVKSVLQDITQIIQFSIDSDNSSFKIFACGYEFIGTPKFNDKFKQIYGDNISENQCDSIQSIYKNSPSTQAGIIEYIITNIGIYTTGDNNDSGDIVELQGKIVEKDFVDNSTGKDWSEYILITTGNEEIRLGDPRFIDNACVASAFQNNSQVTLKLKISKDAANKILSCVIN